MPTLALRPPDELDPVTGRYVRLMRHAATAGEPPLSPMGPALALCDVLAGREPRPMGGDLAEVKQALKRLSRTRPAPARLPLYARALAGWIAHPELDGGGRRLLWAGGDLAFPKTVHSDDAWDTRNSEYLPAMLWEWLWMYAVFMRLKPEDPLNDAGARGNALQMARRQQPSGAILQQDPSTSPEAHWANELIALHALASYALLSGESFAIDSVRRAALYHHRETQPDHATSQPWAVHAFLLDRETIPTADLMLLAAGVNRPGGLDAVSRVLLADAAVCLSVAR